MSAPGVTVVGAGLAGCEVAWQLAGRGVPVTLLEQKPLRRTPAQTSDQLAELVCSNSLRGAALSNAVGLLKEELRRAGSLVLAAADRTRVPAGGALAVDRERFSRAITLAVDAHPLIHREALEVTCIPPERPVVLATGPLTGDALARDLALAVGEDQLAYYDAISPIVAADSVDWGVVFRASRYDKGDDDAYGNIPLDRPGYEAFVAALLAAEKVPPRAFEEARYFEGCLPIEVMASRGLDTLRYGPMKPVGLTDPRTGRWPYAAVQLRPEDHARSAYNLVGFQTRMTWPAQARVLRALPGLAEAEFLRYGSVHRNTFVRAPERLSPELELKGLPGVFLAGQLTGVEGYVESAACGLLCALFVHRRLQGTPAAPPPRVTAFGGLLSHLSTPVENFQPSNVTWALVPPLEVSSPRKAPKSERYEKLAARALEALEAWLPGALEGFHPPALPALEGPPEGPGDGPRSACGEGA
ncbi:MAG: methylenetetrahydrofolate--tRNA-(uracil(54)-C(5))-methyltransferase (FADH(2)-oxidizing) TrmFO [Deltaproteobacteria bacterium]|nr:methylenetetrahydrofolate--tRNA-(uracil(54)-C(5))-methyltransferase (FADH(2)-oxidizing) TrmFO [Deltaproteobacteria bacterium]